MSGEFQADAEDVLIPTSDLMVNEVADYRSHVESLMSHVEEASTTSIIGDMGNALVEKVGEYHQAAMQFLDEIERTSQGVGDFAQMHVEQEGENAAHAQSIDVHML